MRTYHVDRDGDLIDSETDLLADIGDNDVVPASVAQALYEALKELVSAINYPNPDAPDRVDAAERDALEALSLADGEE